MGISATLQLFEDTATTDTNGALGATVKAGAAEQILKNIYTVLKLDYTMKRKCDDQTGRPTDKPTLDVIKVTIRAAKESKATFHRWMMVGDNDNGSVKKGEIKIFDSTGILSSSVQDATGIAPILDTEEIPDLLMDMTGEAMGTAMDDASNYGDYETRDLDKYDEMSHKDLVARAKAVGIVLNDSDKDDDIRELLRTYDKLKSDNKLKKDKELKVDGTKVDDMSSDDLKKYAESQGIKPPEDITQGMSLDELKQYAKDNGISVSGDSEANYKKAVKDYADKKYYQETIKNKLRTQQVRDKIKENNLAEQSYSPAYQKADELKKRTVTSLKGAGTAAVKRNFEVARCITFENAYCISLRESYVSSPNSTGILDSKYPWILELGIKPKKVTFTGEQLATFNLGKDTTAVFDGLFG